MKTKVNISESDTFQSGFSIFSYPDVIPSFQIAFDNKYGVSVIAYSVENNANRRFMFSTCAVAVAKEDKQGNVISKTNTVMTLLDYSPTEEEIQSEMFLDVTMDFLAKIIKVTTELK